MNQLQYNGSGTTVASHQGHEDKKYLSPTSGGQQDKMAQAAAMAAAAAARAANAGYHYGAPPTPVYNHQIPPAWQLAA